MKALLIIGFINLAVLAATYWRMLTMSQAQVDAIKQITDQINRSTAEIKAKIKMLEDAIANAGTDDPAVTAALADLKTAANANDDIAPEIVSEGTPSGEAPDAPV